MKTILFSASLALLFSATASAATLGQVSTADCKSPRGSYLKMDRIAGTLEARFAELPMMTNSAGDELMPIETRNEGGYATVGALTVDGKSEIFGSIVLATKLGTVISKQMNVKAVFRDMSGGVQQEDLLCTFSGN